MARLRGIRAVLLDYGNTLAHPAEPFDEMWARVARERGLVLDPRRLAEARAEADRLFEIAIFEHVGRTSEFWRRYHDVLIGKLEVRDPDGLFAAAVQGAFDRPDVMRLYPEVPEVLRALRSLGLHVGVVSNNTDEIHGRLRDLGVNALFDAVTFSQEAGANKPARPIFDLALRRAGCAPSEAMHVGDAYEADILGARGAGITPVLVDREDRHPDADCLRVRDLRGIEPLIVSQRARG